MTSFSVPGKFGRMHLPWLRGWVCAWLLGVTATLLGHAQPVAQPVGMVKTVLGSAFVERNGARVQARPGLPIYQGSLLVTLAGASLGITFKDDTLLALGPDSQLSLDEYLFEPRQRRFGLLASLLQGTLNYVSGQIAKLRPQAVQLRTPSGMIGVRGTQFVVRVAPP